MTDLRKAAEMALEALCSANPIGHALEDYEYHNKATEALRQALAQNPLDIADRAYFAGKQAGIAETLAQPEQEPQRPVKSYTNNSPQYATDDMSTKSQNIDTSEERVHEIDKSIHEEIERLKAEIKRANELAEYRLKLLMQMPENKPWVSLTDDEKLGAIWTDGSFNSGVEWAEAKLKELNT